MSRVVVVGGGLAGISAALVCVDAGCSVTLVEAKPRLGGLTYSFRRGELEADNGQHVFLRCCMAYRAMLDRLGVADQTVLQERLDIPVLSTWDGNWARLRRARLPAPWHLGSALLVAKNFQRAEDLLERYRSARHKMNPQDWRVFDTLAVLGTLRYHEKKFDAAETLLLQGYEGLVSQQQTMPPHERYRLGRTAKKLVMLYEAWQKPEEAGKWKEKLQK